MSTKRPLAISLLVVLATGCADSTATSDTARTTVDSDSINTENSAPTVRERTVVKLTDTAVAKFKEALAVEPKKHIRLSVKNEGPTGFVYDMQIDDSIQDADFVDKSHGFTLVVDPRSSLYLDGATIDWQTQPDGKSGFKFDNPNAVEQ